MLAVTTGLPPSLSAVDDQLASRLDAADHLDDEVDVGIDDDRVRITGQQPVAQLDVAILRQGAYGDAADIEAQAGPCLDVVGLIDHQSHEGGADVAAAEHPDAHHVLGCHDEAIYLGCRQPTSVASRSSTVSRRTTSR